MKLNIYLKTTIVLILLFVLKTSSLMSQNINYESRITQFYASNCGDDGPASIEEHTWKGWIRDNVNTTENYSGCIRRDHNGAVTQTGTYAVRNGNNTAATQIVGRIDAWEDDRGSRCDYDKDGNPFNNDDDCRVNRTQSFNLSNPLEYQWTTRNETVGSNDYNYNLFYRYRYATISLSNALDNTTIAFSTGGNRPFWGSRGSWAAIGSDCAASGTIGHNQTSSFSTTVSCKSQVRFRWRVSSEANYDFLEVYVNGVRKNRISGNTSWAIVTLNLDYGNNTIEWRYDKDGSRVAGLDRGFVDEISFIDADTVLPGTITSTEERILKGGDPSLISSVSSALAYSNTLNYQWQYIENGVNWININAARSSSYDPPASFGNVSRTYRRRAQDACGNTSYSNMRKVTVMPIAAPTNNSVSTGYIAVDTWNHFYNASNQIIFSLSGDLSGAASAPVVSISVLEESYRDTGRPSNCAIGLSPGDAKFEMQRSWNVDFTGTLKPPYRVRFYYNNYEKDSIINRADAHKAAYASSCDYQNLITQNPSGFFWFKNTGSAYVAPTYDTSTILNANEVALNASISYAEMSQINSFSGGSGALILTGVSVLPVELVRFDAMALSSFRAQLSWATASEKNNRGFYVERSKDGVLFEEIGFVEGNHNSSSLIHYSFIDEGFNGPSFYRLRQVDYNGTVEYSNAVLIKKEATENTELHVRLYPNPSKGTFMLDVPGSNEAPLKIQIFNNQGKEIQGVTLTHNQDSQSTLTSFSVNMQEKAAGIYLVIITKGSHRTVKRLVIE